MWLHGCVPNKIVFNLKIDGHPFYGMPINTDAHALCIAATATSRV